MIGIFNLESRQIMKNRRLCIKCRKSYGDFDLDIDLDIEPTFTAIFGPSGTGKTTALNLISGLVRPDAGIVKWDGRVLSDSGSKRSTPPHKREIGYIFQDSRLFPHKSIASNLKYGWKLTPKAKRRFAFDDVTDVLGLSKFLDRKPDTLSGGQRQRVALGMALLASPGMILMDEPLAALDRTAKLRLLSYLRDIHSKFDLPILYVSHDLTTIINFAQNAIVLHNGKATYFDDASKVLTGNGEIGDNGDVENIFHATVKEHFAERGIVELDAGGFALTASDSGRQKGDNVLVEIPSSEIIIAVSKPTGISARNIIKGSVAAIHTIRRRCLVDIDIGKRITAEILEDTKTELGLEPGLEVYVIIKAKCIHSL